MTDPTDELFRLESVEVERGGRRVLGSVDLVIPGTGPVVVAGPSGSGKSSLLRLLNRLDAPSSGRITYRGTNLADAEPTVHRRRVAMVFQRPVVLPGTVGDNLHAADADLDPPALARALGRVGLDSSFVDRPARDLSGGEAQRLCLARSLATNPEVVLFDEPTSSLDPASAARIEELAVGLGHEDITCIWVTHDLGQLRRLAAQVIVIIDGKIAQSGPVDAVLDAPNAAVGAFLEGGDA